MPWELDSDRPIYAQIVDRLKHENQSMNRKHRNPMSVSVPIQSRTLPLSWKHSLNSIQQLRKRNLPTMSKTVCLLLYPATMYFQNW